MWVKNSKVNQWHMERGTFLTIAVGDYREVREVRMTHVIMDQNLSLNSSQLHTETYGYVEKCLDMSVYRG